MVDQQPPVAHEASGAEPPKRAAAERFRGPLLRLLAYVRTHPRPAVLTVLFGTAGFLLSFVYPWIIGSVVDLIHNASVASLAQRQARLSWLTQLAAATGIGHALVVYGRGHFNTKLGNSVVADLRRDLFEHLQSLSVRFYATQRIGTILSRVLQDVEDASEIIYMGIVVAIMDAIQLILAFVFLSSIDAQLTLVCGVVFPFYALAFGLLNPRVRAAADRARTQLARMSGDIAERFAGQTLVKTYTAEQREAARFRKEVAEHHALVVAESHAGHLVAAVAEGLVHLGTTIVIGFGGWLALRGKLTAGMLTQFLGYVVILYGPVRRFAELNTTYQSSFSAMRRVFHVLDIQPAVAEPARPQRCPPQRGRVVFDQVRFCYAEGDDEWRVQLEDDCAPVTAPRSDGPWVLDGVSFAVQPGERVAIVGASGAGKSTLLSLVPRLFDPNHGRVLVDEVDVREYALRSLRSAIGIVQQDSFVFTGSVAENIAYGRPDASEQDIMDCARAAHAHDFITQFSAGYATQLGERGVNLSGGQRQRISIARALLKDPRILILDEATSALDMESERLVQQALDVLMHGRTCFISAHRLSTIQHADRILVLHAGRVAESGTHRELLDQGGIYARFLQTNRVLN
jgi:ABC-type multidrug transport system fused ATPase/permease subunit